MTACVIWKWKKLCLMSELNTFSAVTIKLKTSRPTPIYQESTLHWTKITADITRTGWAGGLILKRTMVSKLYNNHKQISLGDKDFLLQSFVPMLSQGGCYEVLRGSWHGVPRWRRPDKIIIDCLITARAINRDIVWLLITRKWSRTIHSDNTSQQSQPLHFWLIKKHFDWEERLEIIHFNLKVNSFTR